MDNLFLIYVGSAGNLGSREICEFYFSEVPRSAIGDGWEMSARDNAMPPDPEFVHRKFRLVGEVSLRLLEKEYELRYLDGVYKVARLAWEDVDYDSLSPAEFDALDERMLRFSYGDSLVNVLQQLHARGCALEVVSLELSSDEVESEEGLDDLFPDTGFE